MTLSRRSFLKVAGLTVVAAAGASMFTGCSFTTPITYVAADAADKDVASAVEKLNGLHHVVFPADAYKNKDYMTGYMGSLLTTAGVADTVEVKEYVFVEATDKEAAYLKVTVQKKTASK